MDSSDNESWKELRRLILFQMEEHTKELTSLKSEINDLNLNLAILKTKHGMWSAMISFVVSAVAWLVATFMGK